MLLQAAMLMALSLIVAVRLLLCIWAFSCSGCHWKEEHGVATGDNANGIVQVRLLLPVREGWSRCWQGRVRTNVAPGGDGDSTALGLLLCSGLHRMAFIQVVMTIALALVVVIKLLFQVWVLHCNWGPVLLQEVMQTALAPAVAVCLDI